MSDFEYDDDDDYDSVSEYEIDIEDATSYGKNILMSSITKKSDDKLTTFEITNILIYRARQLNNGYLPNIDITWQRNAIEIAKDEFRQRKINLQLIRHLPNGNKIILLVDSMDR